MSLSIVMHKVPENFRNEGYLDNYKDQKIKSKDGLRNNFYKKTCPSAELIVRNVTQSYVLRDPTVASQLLRMHFHDCFVRGCDGSFLLNSTANSTAEMDDIMNARLGRFEVIEDIKSQLEKQCEGIVSCADILALAARDAISFQYKRDLWRVPTGRRDGRISHASEVPLNIPSPFSYFFVQEEFFAKKGLSIHDLVVLSGAHTVGRAHCQKFTFRLYNFTGHPPDNQDPTMNKTYAEFLKTKCNSPFDMTTTVEMDQGSSRIFDNHYYINLKQNKGLFATDAQLLTNRTAIKIIDKLVLSNTRFLHEFGKSMEKLGRIDLKTGTEGEIRRKCSLVN
ncbi:peroxidase 3-like [Silene latifolia]|uniref:peroxidase 3-like n=1 Tax=Silene latifolia TaxID=37657 RepID=UPI003D7859B3